MDTFEVETALRGYRSLTVRAKRIAFTISALAASWKLSLVNIVNASAWLILLLLTQFEIANEATIRERKRIFVSMVSTKVVLYAALTFNAAYWVICGNWIDGWDAALWLVAIVMIDVNLFRFRDVRSSY